MDADTQPEAVKNRQHRQHSQAAEILSLPKAAHGERLEGAGVEIPVGKQNSLACTGRAAAVQNHGGLVRRPPHRTRQHRRVSCAQKLPPIAVRTETGGGLFLRQPIRRRHRQRHFIGKRRHHDSDIRGQLVPRLVQLMREQIQRGDQPAFGVPHIKRDLLRCRQRVHHIRHRADAVDRIKQHDRLRAVGHTDRDRVAAPDSRRRQCRRHALRIPQQAGVGNMPPHKAERRFPGVCRRRTGEQLIHALLRIVKRRGRVPVKGKPRPFRLVHPSLLAFRPDSRHCLAFPVHSFTSICHMAVTGRL